ncbi:MAG: type II 3-dehydroquinate dehydratase [Acetobacteraceae bacterium]|nr:type II 3-dehydroquinate dehydratase [Acetobacteraceae bacterium]
MPKFLVVHGAGMDMRGKVQVDVFGPMTLPEYDAAIRGFARELGVAVEIFHSNLEGEVINRLYAAHEDASIDAALINPAGFTRGYPALNGAIAALRFPVIEVHISNPAKRGLISDVLAASRGGVSGFGLAGYEVAMRGLLAVIKR